MVAECVAEGCADFFTSDSQDLEEFQGGIQKAADLGKMAAPTVALLIGLDGGIAQRAGNNALENNFIPHFIPLGIALINIIDNVETAQEIYTIYEQEGIGPAAERLGIEILIDVAGGATFKVGGKWIYKSGTAAINCVLSSKPGIKAYLGAKAGKLRRELESLAGSGGPDSAKIVIEDLNPKGPYNPRVMRETLEGRYPEGVTSSTIPSKNMPNVKLAGKADLKTKVPFDQRGLPIFDKYAVYDTHISHDLSLIQKRDIHFKAATRDLKQAINSGKIDPKNFNDEQLRAIQKESGRIPGLTWHHHQDRGRMQLVPKEFHKTSHVGGMSMWFFEQKNK